MVEVSDFIEGTYFGIISGAITTIGLIVGMNSGTGSKVAIIVSILTIAISDTLSDAFGMYMSKKAGNLEDNSTKPLKEAIGVLASKFIISMSFLIPFVCINSLSASSYTSIGWAYTIIIAAAAYLTRLRKENLTKNLIKYVLITTVVVVLTHFTGECISTISG